MQLRSITYQFWLPMIIHSAPALPDSEPSVKSQSAMAPLYDGNKRVITEL